LINHQQRQDIEGTIHFDKTPLNTSVIGSLQSRQSSGIDVLSNSFLSDSGTNPLLPLNQTNAIGKSASVPPTIDEFLAFRTKISKKNELNGVQPQGIRASWIKKYRYG
jgi:hypothetical protein